MAITVQSLDEMNLAALSDVAAELGKARTSFTRADERLDSGVLDPLLAGVAWSGNGQPAAVTTVRADHVGLRVVATRTATARNAVLGLQAGLTAAQDLARRMVQQAEARDLAVGEGGEVTVKEGVEYAAPEGDEENTQAAAERITVQLVGALSHAEAVDGWATQLLDRAAEGAVTFTDWADGAALAANRDQLAGAAFALVASAAGRVAWELAEPRPVLDTGHPTSGQPIGPIVDNWEYLSLLGQLLAALGAYLPEGLSVTFKDERSREQIEADGQQKVELTAVLDLRAALEAAGETKTGVFGGSLEAFIGKSLEYRVLTDPESAGRFVEGGSPVVPWEPASVPVGTSVILDDKFYYGFDASGEYRKVLHANLGYTAEHKVSTGLERVDADTVRVHVGDSDLVESRAGGSFGVDDLNVNLELSRSLSEGKIRTIDLDISTAAGRDVYEQFLATGVLPAGGTEGTSNESVTDVSDAAGNTDVGLDAGPVNVPVIDESSSSLVSTTINGDGSTERSVDYQLDNLGMQYKVEYDADGQVTDTIRNINVGDETRTFDDDRLNEVRERVLQNYALSASAGDGSVTADEVQQALDGAENEATDTVNLVLGTDLRILEADTPSEIYNVLFQESNDDPDRLDYLIDQYHHQAVEYAEVTG